MKSVRAILLAVALAWLLISARTCVVWMAPRPTHGAARFVHGTELASAFVPSISLALDDRWLVFAECTEDRSAAYKLQLRDAYTVASIDLETGCKMSYKDTIQCGSDEFDYRTIGWDGPASWQDDAFLLRKCNGRGKYVAIRKGHPQLDLVARSAAPLTCSDCESRTLPQQTIDWPARLVNHWSFTSDGSAVYYERDGVRMSDASQAGRVVVGESSKKYLGMTTEFAQLRVSPDQHYLAYCVNYSLNVPIVPGSGWVEYLYIKNLKSGREVRIAARSSLSNLVWSRDSGRLYFAGIDLPRLGQVGPSAGGIFVVDTHDIFGDD